MLGVWMTRTEDGTKDKLKERKRREWKRERERGRYNEGNGFTLSFVSPLICSLSSFLPRWPFTAGNELPEDILREKGLGDSRRERNRRKWKVGEREEEKEQKEGEREQELTSEIVWTLFTVYFCELKAVEAQKARGNWSKLVYLHTPLLSSVFVPQFYRC